MPDEYLSALADDMAAALEALRKGLNTVRTGRATPALLDGVQVHVSAYGAVMPIRQLATISAPDPRLLVVTPWDKSTLADIEKAIVGSGLGLNPSNDGNLVRVPIPPLTGERRQELTRLVRRQGEDARVRIRGVRREYNEIFRQMEAEGEVSQDELDRLLKKVQRSTDEYVKKVDERVARKETEILEG